MAPPEGSSAIIAPSAGPQGRKPAEVRPEPVTPKTLFNGATAPRGADEINALSERTSALRINDLPVEGGVNGAEVNKPVANTSDKGNAKIQDLEDDGGYLSDDPDECQDPVVLNEIAAQAGVAITLLVPFAWSKEIPCIIVTVNHLLSLWGKHMSGNVCKTTRCQKLTPTFLSKQHFGRAVAATGLHAYFCVILPPSSCLFEDYAAVKTLLADPAMAFTSRWSLGGVGVCAQEECGKAHGTSFETAVEHVQTIHHGTGLLKAGAATRVSMGKQNVAQVWKEFGL
ncbi:unnamed protein product [Closterium sp. NIES-65]|nr:unnamed protein product [Closterium sp. NIES-65]